MNLNELLKYDPETGKIYKIWWRNKPCNPIITGYVCDLGYTRVYVGKKLEYASRIAWELYYGKKPKYVHHINGIKTDNRICNLVEKTTWGKNHESK